MQRWSVVLDIGEPRALTVAGPARIVVGGSSGVAAYDARGGRQWRLELPCSGLQALSEGRTLLRTSEEVRLLDFLGATLARWNRPGHWAPRPLGEDRLIDLDDAGVLACTGLDGTVWWQAELGCRPLHPPTTAHREVVVSDSSGLRLYDDRGRLQGRVEIGGPLRFGQTLFAGAEGRILAFAGGYLAPFRQAARGSGWYFWRPEHGDVVPFGAGAALSGPAGVTGELFVAGSPDHADDGKQFARAFTPSNARAWELAVPRLVAVEGLPGGRVALVSSPAIERWEQYRIVHPVEDECRVTIVDRGGAVSGLHVAREPLTSLAAHADGLLFVVKGSLLLALAVDWR